MVGKWHLCPDRRDEPRLHAAQLADRAAASSASTASSAPRPTSGIPTSSTTTTRSIRRGRPRRATTSPRTSPTRRSSSSRTPRRSRPRSRSSSTTRPAPATRRTTRRRSGSTATRAGSTWATRRCASRPWPARRSWASCRPTPSCRRSTRSARRRRAPGPDGKPFPPLDYTRPWDSLSDDEQRLFARMAEVYAGFLAHADHQIGRLLDYLEETGQRENTLIIVVSDNGASGEGGPNGSVNEMQVRQRHPRRHRGEPRDARRARRHRRPTTTTPTAGRWRSTRRSRCGSATSSTAAPSRPVHHLLAGRDRRRAARSATSTTTRSTSSRRSSTCLGVEPPETIKGHVQSHFDGVSMRYSFDDADRAQRPRRRSSTRCSARAAIWHDGWKAVTTHPTISGWSHFNDDTWELYHVDVDRSELHDLAAEQPDKLRELVNLWFAEAGANGAFPLDDRSALEILITPRPQLSAAAQPLRLLPGRRADVPESQAVNIRNRSFAIGAVVDIPAPGARGRAVRARLALRRARALRQGRPAALRLQLRRQRRAEGRRHRGRADRRGPDPVGLLREGRRGPAGVATGTLSLYHGDEQVGEGRIKTQPGKFALAGAGSGRLLLRAQHDLRRRPGTTRLPGPKAPGPGRRPRHRQPARTHPHGRRGHPRRRAPALRPGLRHQPDATDQADRRRRGRVPRRMALPGPPNRQRHLGPLPDAQRRLGDRPHHRRARGEAGRRGHGPPLHEHLPGLALHHRPDDRQAPSRPPRHGHPPVAHHPHPRPADRPPTAPGGHDRVASGPCGRFRAPCSTRCANPRSRW